MLERRFQFGHRARRVDQAVDLEIERQAAVVEVGRADGGPDAVHQHHLRVHHPLGVLVHLDPGVEHLAPVVAGREQGQPFVRVVLAQEAHVDPEVPRQLERVAQARVGHEIGRGDPDALTGLQDRGEIDFANPLGVAVRAGFDDLGRIGAVHALGLEILALGQRILGVRQVLAGGKVPVLGEDALQIGHRRAPQPQVFVAPVAEALDLAQVLVADVQPAQEPDVAVHHEDLAVVAQVHL